MKALKLLLMVSIVALFVLAGCSSNAQQNYPPQGQRYVGGGCGVQAPAEDTSAAQAVATALQPALAA